MFTEGDKSLGQSVQHSPHFFWPKYMLKASHQEHWCWIQFFKKLTTQSPRSLTCWKWQMNQGYIKCHQVQKRIGIMVTWCLSPVAVPVVNYTLVRPCCAWDTETKIDYNVVYHRFYSQQNCVIWKKKNTHPSVTY